MGAIAGCRRGRWLHIPEESIMRHLGHFFFVGLLLLVAMLELPAQDKQVASGMDPALFSALKYRPIGPFRGGRSAACCGVPGKPMQFYFGATGGGLWKTTDGGATWDSVSDGFFGGSIGAVEVCPADRNVIYVGGGEVTVRGNVAHGSGMWKSTDAGKTWKSIGLGDTHHIPRIRTHPGNPDLVYVAALGHLYGPNNERGVFRSQDGGKTWENILFVNEEVGAVDLILDPANPRILYASTWRVKRTPYSLESGGPGSGLWKSTDSGDTWTEITRKPGLPKGTVGIIGVAVSPVDSDRVWAIVEADDGGVFRSEDGGENWQRLNQDTNLRQRAWYYTRIYAGPKNKDEVYVVNVQFWRSNDGGKTYSSIRAPHGDYHDLWIDPDDPERMIVANDGGAQVSFNHGKTWSTYMNQPTAQFYRVTTDNHFPYRIYGAQQDNSTVRILSRSDGFTIGERDWEPTAGSESGWIAPNLKDPDIVYGGNYSGYLGRINHRTKERRVVSVWPDDSIGHGAANLKYRFQWNFPIAFSPHDSGTLYAAGNMLFKTTNEGQSWQPISPDLTRDDKSKQGPSGGPITKDNTTVEYYCTIFAAAESPLEKGVLWCGSDDGLIHVSKDAGKSWNKVTPPDLPEWAQINSIEPHPSVKGGLYVAATRYKTDDFRPYLYQTLDYGTTWTKIVTGIPEQHFARVIRADPARKGLLYAGTEQGMYISFDDGGHWQSFQLNLPIVPITDLAIKNHDLIVATQGRSFWVLDDLTALHKYYHKHALDHIHPYEPRRTYRLGGGSTETAPKTAGQNPPSGAVVYFWLINAPTKVAPATVEILDKDRKVIRRFTLHDAAEEVKKPAKGGATQKAGSEASGKTATAKPEEQKATAGLNRFVWDLRYGRPEEFPGMVLWGGLTAPRAVPGRYLARFRAGGDERTVTINVLPDPRSTATIEDMQEQFNFVSEVGAKLTEAHRAIKRLRDVREQVQALVKRLDPKKHAEAVKSARQLIDKMTAAEEALYQTKSKAPQDVLNYPIRLNNKLASLASNVAAGDDRPTDQAVKLKDELFAAVDAELSRLRQVFTEEVPRFNDTLRRLEVPPVILNVDE
jgi:photosystem II stability/assembly factor-like uncharacterized protein